MIQLLIRSFIIAVLSTIILNFASLDAEAVSVRLNSGKTLRGPLVGVSNNKITVLRDGRRVTVTFDDIKSISKGAEDKTGSVRGVKQKFSEYKRRKRGYKHDRSKESRRNKKNIERLSKELKQSPERMLRKSWKMEAPVSKRLQKRRAKQRK